MYTKFPWGGLVFVCTLWWQDILSLHRNVSAIVCGEHVWPLKAGVWSVVLKRVGNVNPFRVQEVWPQHHLEWLVSVKEVEWTHYNQTVYLSIVNTLRGKTPLSMVVTVYQQLQSPTSEIIFNLTFRYYYESYTLIAINCSASEGGGDLTTAVGLCRPSNNKFL